MIRRSFWYTRPVVFFYEANIEKNFVLVLKSILFKYGKLLIFLIKLLSKNRIDKIKTDNLALKQN